MSSKTTTLITNIYNEEYLLPFWLQHHKSMFDNIIIVDYNSTDNSLEICKQICPDCIILKSKNEFFSVLDIDSEFMGIELCIDGIKIILNTTEFLFCDKPLKDLFTDDIQISQAISVITPYSSNNYEVINNNDLFTKLLNDDVVYHHDRGFRHLHNFPHGCYLPGRHETMNNNSIITTDAYIVWFGYFPMNDKLLQRKIQIHKNMLQSDREAGMGWQHWYTKDEMLNLNKEKSQCGKSLKDLNEPFYNYLMAHIANSIDM